MISRATLLAGSGYGIAPGSVSFRCAGTIKVTLKWNSVNVTDALKGPFDKIVTDRWLEATFTPLYYDPTNTTAIFFPWISLQATPPGVTQIFGTTDEPWSFVGNNGITITFKAGAVTAMPTIDTSIDKPFFGQMTVIGINATGTDPSSASSFYSISSGNTFTPPAIPGTAVLARQKWSAVFGSNSGWSAFQAYEGFQISHELGLKWITDSAQRIGALLTGYRAMAKCIPSGNTLAQLASQMAFSGTGAIQGQRYTADENDLIISGAVSGTITAKNSSIESGEINFAAEVLNQGEVAFITNVGDNSGANVASLILA
jgi:hypothetical protein